MLTRRGVDFGAGCAGRWLPLAAAGQAALVNIAYVAPITISAGSARRRHLRADCGKGAARQRRHDLGHRRRAGLAVLVLGFMAT